MIARVLLGLQPREMEKCFDYRVPEGMLLVPGARVIVPFGRRNAKAEGYVLSLADKTDIPPEKMKDILEAPDGGKPIFTPVLLGLAEWMREQYFCSLAQCLQAILPAGIRTKSSWVVRAKAIAAEAALTPKERAVLEYLEGRQEVPLEEFEAEFRGNMPEYLRRMEKKGLLELHQRLRRSGFQREKIYYSLDKTHPCLEAIWQKAERDKRLEGQRLLLEALSNGAEKTAEELKESPGITDSPIKTLCKKGVLLMRRQIERRKVVDAEAFARTEAFQPTAEQAAVLAALRAERQKAEKRPVLLHGVTGSGKTEIYLQIIADVLREGKQAIVLVPEIALTPQILERFLSRFGDAVSVTHSRLSMGERVDQWRRAQEGEISVMIGPRSALFTPFADVGAIILDEAHENSYLSDITPKYDAREVAEEAARRYGALLLMGTATPDLIRYHKAKMGEYLLLELKERTGGGSLPQIFITDLRRELAEGNHSPFGRALQEAICENLQKGEQTMLFLNRRGSASFVSCRSCGEAMTCPECNIAYTFHAKENALVCHYCGRRAAVPKICPQCGSKYIRYFGTGTQKIEAEAERLFPQARILRMDLDTTLTKHSHEKILEAFGKGDADILIGTQMIVKGHDFPKVTLVGILAADLSLHIGGYAAAENAFRLMTQAAGRAGRSALPGRVFLQSYQPEHYAVKYAAAQDFQGFYAEESLLRQMMGYPPFAVFYCILLTGAERAAVAAAAQEMQRRLAAEDAAAMVFDAVAAVPEKFRGEYRYQIIVKAEREEILRRLVLPIAAELRQAWRDAVRLQILRNPENLVS